ncbi:hypothetical protein [Paenibacillus lignilyticus]|uniref:Lipoprotein SmpA/OmlA domain-containing protein n=1 Tax=Paenibacillus lignilyticus TaxID=1172615 RepID=A0ABS5CHZ4_9BACL|nr:hypothetical protein [Paenibacillus lignilyticus]MBP3965426.1 hypothetical protein [Paenibacillus lignilyticus]
MKRIMQFIILISGLAVLLAACGGKSETPLTFIDKVGSTDLSAEKSGDDVKFGITEKELVTALGKPQRTLNNGRTFLFMYEEYQYTSLENVVLAYSLGPKVATAKGVKLGDTRENAQKLYGESYYTRGNAIGYIDKENRLALEFELKDDRIAAISVSALAMYE